MILNYNTMYHLKEHALGSSAEIILFSLAHTNATLAVRRNLWAASQSARSPWWMVDGFWIFSVVLFYHQNSS